MVIVIGLDIAGLPVTHNNDEVIATVTISPVVSVDDEYVELPVPTSDPLTFHWYEGVPPLTGEAVNVTKDPAQAGFDDAAMDTLAGRFEVTVIVTILDVAGLPVAHVALDVITT
jgi:hypothetical protein